MATNLLNSRLVLRFGSDRLLLWGTGTAALAGVVLPIAAWTDWGGLAGLAVPLFFYVSASGLIVAKSIAGALSGFPERAGTVAALVGAMQYGSRIIGSALVGLVADGTPCPLGWVIAPCGLGRLASARLLVRRMPATSTAGKIGAEKSDPGRHPSLAAR